MQKQKRALAIHDISCFGRCSLTVALPILSAAGIETSVIPTAVLSTHTGGFTGYTWRDLTCDIRPISRHWQGLGIGFDAIYTGFLGSFEQLDIVGETIDSLRAEGTLVVVDPVMADDGKLYPVFGADFPAGMRGLCARADVIVPNLTEAALMLGEPYAPGPLRMGDAEGLLKRLCGLGPGRAVITGVAFDENSLGAAFYDAATGETGCAMAKRVGGMYHGTGDVFASALSAALIRGQSLRRACETAVGFTVSSIERSHIQGTDTRFGVNFEAGLGEFSRSLDAD